MFSPAARPQIHMVLQHSHTLTSRKFRLYLWIYWSFFLALALSIHPTSVRPSVHLSLRPFCQSIGLSICPSVSIHLLVFPSTNPPNPSLYLSICQSSSSHRHLIDTSLHGVIPRPHDTTAETRTNCGKLSFPKAVATWTRAKSSWICTFWSNIKWKNMIRLKHLNLYKMIQFKWFNYN